MLIVKHRQVTKVNMVCRDLIVLKVFALHTQKTISLKLLSTAYKYVAPITLKRSGGSLRPLSDAL